MPKYKETSDIMQPLSLPVREEKLTKGVKTIELETKLRGFSPQANYTDRATAACRRS
jgi:hypothetical protein